MCKEKQRLDKIIVVEDDNEQCDVCYFDMPHCECPRCDVCNCILPDAKMDICDLCYLRDITFHSPTSQLTVENWPLPGKKTSTAYFRVVRSYDGRERVAKSIEGIKARPRYSRKAKKVRIVTGSDDRTYTVGIISDGLRFVLFGTMRRQIVVNSTSPIFRAVGEVLR